MRSCFWHRDFSWPCRGPQGIQDSAIETGTQVLQRSRQSTVFHPLGQRGHLPEVLKCLSDIVLFALQAKGNRSARMTMQPAAHHPAEAVLHPCPAS